MVAGRRVLCVRNYMDSPPAERRDVRSRDSLRHIEGTRKLLSALDLCLLEASLPNVEFFLQAEGEASFDQLDCLLKGNRGCRGEQDVQMVRHDDEGVELVFALGAVIEKGLLEQLCRGCYLEEAAALGCGRGDVIGPGFLRGETWGQHKRKARG